jgi:hypothetical protein
MLSSGWDLQAAPLAIRTAIMGPGDLVAADALDA